MQTLLPKRTRRSIQKAPRRDDWRRRGQRSGVATLWVLLAVPGVVIMLVFVTDIANIWLARIEATNAMEASALAAVKEWKDLGNTSANRTRARRAAVAYAAANTVLGQFVSITPNQNKGSGDVNDNASPLGNVVLGEFRPLAGQTVFNPNQSPTASGNFAIHTQAHVPVASLWNDFGGFSFGPYSVSVEAVALFRDGDEPRLVRIDRFLP